MHEISLIIFAAAGRRRRQERVADDTSAFYIYSFLMHSVSPPHARRYTRQVSPGRKSYMARASCSINTIASAAADASHMVREISRPRPSCRRSY